MLKRDLERRGHRLVIRDGRLFIVSDNSSALTDTERASVKSMKEILLTMADAVVPCSWCGKVHDGGPEQCQPTATVPFQSLASFLDTVSTSHVEVTPDAPPDLTGIDHIILNFATSGLNWAHGHRPVGVTIATPDGGLVRFLPFAFKGGGNLDEAIIKRWMQEQVRGKKITNSKTKFDIHHAREWGVDLEAQGCTFSDIQHSAALLDDHRKRFALDILAAEYLKDSVGVPRVDETRHSDYHAAEVAERERYTALTVGRLLDVFAPQLIEQDLLRVQALEDSVIPSVVEMEKNGALIDVELLERYSRECTVRHGELMREIIEEAGFAFDHTSKAWQRLFEKCNLVLGDSHAESVVGVVEHPLIKKAFFAGQIASLNSKTFAAYRSKLDGDVLRFEINQLRGDEGGTVSGRFSIGYVQQVPNYDNHSSVFGDEWFPRSLFVPRSGCYLEADAAQIEYRLFAHFAGNAKVLASYKEDPGLSFHKMTWEMMKQYKADMLYGHQKNFNFARQYGARSVKLAIMMKFITQAEGDEIRAASRWNDPRLKQIHEIEAAYKQMMPEGEELLDRASHLAKPECDKYCRKSDKFHREKLPHRGYVKTIIGRRSRFPTSYKTYIGLNRVLQGSGADIMKQKLVELHNARKDTGFLMRMTVHDAVGGDAQQPETLERVKTILNEQSFPLRVPVIWECGEGKNWAEAK